MIHLVEQDEEEADETGLDEAGIGYPAGHRVPVVPSAVYAEGAPAGPNPLAEGRTTFNFISANPGDALAKAIVAANGKDVRIGSGPTIVREYLKAGLVDHLHVAIAPILLGRGIRLWDDLRGLEGGYTIHSETAESGTIHLTFKR